MNQRGRRESKYLLLLPTSCNRVDPVRLVQLTSEWTDFDTVLRVRYGTENGQVAG